MNSSSNQDLHFQSFFKNLKDFSEESRNKLKDAISEQNLKVISDLESCSFNIDKALYNRIENIVVLQKRAEAFEVLESHLEQIISEEHEFSIVVRKNPVSFEHVLWLLYKINDQELIEKAQRLPWNTLGEDTFSSLREYNNLDLKALEASLQPHFDSKSAKKYVSDIKKLYSISNDDNDAEENKEDPQNPNVPEQQPSEEIDPTNDPNGNLAAEAPKLTTYFNFTQTLGIPTNFSADECHTFDCMLRKKAETSKLMVDSTQSCDQNQSNKDELFTDGSFPAVPESVTTNFEKYPMVKDFIWKRIPEIYTQPQLKVCSDNMGPDDILQGKLGNCYFLSTLSALVIHKPYITRLFESMEISKNGQYSIWLNDSGEWKKVIIDDIIPCHYRDDVLIPRFSQTKSNDIWTLLLEKAFAKIYGMFFTIGIGYQGEAFSVLAGAPFKYLKIKKNGIELIEQVWNFVADNLKKDFFITVSSRRESEELKNKEMGIVSGHIYTVLDAREVTLPDGKKERIVKMRNPWGNREWCGEWGDQSPYWTKDMKKLLNYEPKLADGVFWICLADFRKYFCQQVCGQVHKDYGYSFIRLGENRKQNVFVSKMNVKKTGFAYITAHQKRIKHFVGNKAYQYSCIRMIIARYDANGEITSIVHGKYRNHPNLVIRRNFDEGNYLVLIEVDWIQNLHNELILSSYSGVEIEFQEQPLSNYSIPHLYGQLLRAYILTSDDPKIRRTQLKKKGELTQTWKMTVGAKYGLSGSLFINKEADLDLHYQISVKKLNKVVMHLPEGDDLLFTIIIPPGEERVMLFKAFMETPVIKLFGHVYNESHIYKKANRRLQTNQQNRVIRSGVQINKNSLATGEVRNRTQNIGREGANKPETLKPITSFGLLDVPKKIEKSDAEKNKPFYILIAVSVILMLYKALYSTK